MPKGHYERSKCLKKYPCALGCGKMFAQLKSSRKCATCIRKRASGQHTAPETEQMDATCLPVLLKQMNQWKNQVELNLETRLEEQKLALTAQFQAQLAEVKALFTGRGSYSTREERPARGFSNWDADAFIKNILPAREWVHSFELYKGQIDIFNLPFLHFIAHVLYFMNGKSQIVYLRDEYATGRHKEPLFLDLNYEKRLRKKMTVKHALKNLCSRDFIPTWAEIQEYLEHNGVNYTIGATGAIREAFSTWDASRSRMCTRFRLPDKHSASFELRMGLLKALGNYQSPQKRYDEEKRAESMDNQINAKRSWEMWLMMFDYEKLNDRTDWNDVIELERQTCIGGTFLDNPILINHFTAFFRHNSHHYDHYKQLGGQFVLKSETIDRDAS